MYCEPHCDPSDSTSALFCGTSCADYVLLGRLDGSIIAGRCTAP